MKWENAGQVMLLNMETARDQYSDLGYPHRKYKKLRCPECRKITLVDETIEYRFCPHCGALAE